MNVLGELTEAIDAVCEAEPARLADRESIQHLHRQLERLNAATTRATAAFEAGGTWEADGARSAAAWLATRVRTALPAARRRLRLGRALRHMAHAEAAWLAGEIDADHVAALAEARTPVSTDCFEHDEAMLVEQAARLSHRHFSRALAYWCQRADPDGTEDRVGRIQRPAPAPVPELRRQLGPRRRLRSHRRRRARPGAPPHRRGALRHRLGRGPGPRGRGGLRR